MVRNLEGEDIRKSIGKKIRQLREMKDMTQVELAAAVGMSSTGAISQIENGDKGAKLHSIIRIARVLGVHPIVLLTVEDLDKDDLELMINMMSFFKKKQRDPKSVRPHLDAIRKILED